jgi:hypothetical protein
MRSHAQSTLADAEAEIGEAVDLIVHVGRETGRRVVHEVAAINGYDRVTQQFSFELVSSQEPVQPVGSEKRR